MVDLSLMDARLHDALFGMEPLSSRELQQRIGCTQATISRLIAAAGDRIVRLGRGRSTRYGLSTDVFGLRQRVPIFSISGEGDAEELAMLRTLSSGQYLVDGGKHLPFWLLGQRGNGLYDALPYFLYDLRPQGFIGRQTARHLSRVSDVPDDPRRWNDEHLGKYLLTYGHDVPGNLVFGATRAAQARDGAVAVVEDHTVAYLELAHQALHDDHLPGSSAGGEQPKFLCYRLDTGHVVVKFSAAGDGPEAKRWKDLLRAEHHALCVLRQWSIPAAPSAIYDMADRVFLELRRFDRVGQRGRLPALSLGMVDAEFTGIGHDWSRMAQALARNRLLDAESERHLIWAHTFGQWIGNNDMHPGNICLGPTQKAFRLLPIFDMLPMGFAPVRGELPNATVRAPLRTRANQPIWDSAQRAAADYWTRLGDDAALSHSFRALAKAQRRTCLA